MNVGKRICQETAHVREYVDLARARKLYSLGCARKQLSLSEGTEGVKQISQGLGEIVSIGHWSS